MIFNNNNNDDIPRLESGEKIKVDLDIDFKKINIRKRKYPFLLLLLLILLATIGVFILKKSQENIADFENDVEASLEGEVSAWQGAFASKEIFEACRESSVLIIAQGRRCSGFIYSSDGWIVTMEGVVGDSVKGQIEVFLFDGRRYLVESFRQNRESGITLMKINANNLSTVNVSTKTEISAGEELYSFCFVGDTREGGSLFSGRVSHVQRDVNVFRADGTSRELKLFQIGILLTEDGVGAPLFNGSGELVGIACASGEKSDEPFMVEYAFAFCNVKSLISTMKDGKTVDSDQLSLIVVE